MRPLLQWLCIVIPCFAHGQPGFNITYNLGYDRNQFRKLIVVEDTIIACGIARSDSFPYPQCLLVARFDSSGAVIDHRLICDSLGDALSVAINWTDLVATSDGGYAFTAGCVFRNNGMLVKLRHDLSTEFVKEYIDTTDLVEFYNAIIELPDGYLLGGYAQRPNYLQDAFLRRIDMQGNSLWYKYYGEYNETDLFGENIKLNDSLYAFAGGYRKNPNQLGGRGPWISIINTDGEVIKEWRPQSNVPFEILHGIYKVSADYWLVRGVNTVSGPPFYYQFFLATIDTNFQVESVRPYGSVRPYLDFIEDVEPTVDGNFIGAGYWYSENPNIGPDIYGRLLKFSPAPDSLWSLTLTAPIPNVDQSGNYLGGVGVLSSGNMIAGGYAAEGNNVYPWLVKITPEGCVDTLWCVSTPTWEPRGSGLYTAGELHVWPNPTFGPVDLSGFPETGRPLAGKIFDATGRLVNDFTVPASYSELPLSLAGLPAGLYQIVLTDGSGAFWQARVVRQ